MGELKALRTEQESTIEKLKELNQKLRYAALGAFSKVEERANGEVDKLVAAAGDEATDDNKLVAAAKGLLAKTREQFESLEGKRDEALQKYISAGAKARGDEVGELNKYVLAGLGAVSLAREESEKFFNELVAAGQQRS